MKLLRCILGLVLGVPFLGRRSRQERREPTRRPRGSRPCSNHDYHATVLHLLGIDHTRLTFLHNGLDRRAW